MGVLTVAAVLLPFLLLGGACERSDDGSRVLEVTVGPELRNCVGVGPQTCMAVAGELF